MVNSQISSDQFFAQTLPQFTKIYIEECSRDSEVSQRVQALYPQNIIQFVETGFVNAQRGEMTSEEFNNSKKTLLLTEFKGQFFKRCPGATQKKTLTCCNYHVLNLGSQCNMNCSYCYLQSYLNTKMSLIYTNIDQALSELKSMIEEFPNHPFRVGTGEVIDSLSLDQITLYSRKLIEFFKQYPKWVLEFKTKSNKVDQFLDIHGAQNIVVSWSINPAYVIDREEYGTARFHERLDAAKKCRDQGYKLAFHIDPMIYHLDWKKNYGELVDILTSTFTPEEVQVISIGTLRFQPEQRHMMRERFGVNSLVVGAEMFPSEGNKLRYDASLRGEMLQFVYKRLKSKNETWNAFFCMETPETWISALEKVPMQIPELKEMFKPLPQVQ
ncbi:MAG: radical SAM protein [Pseudobdellovibrio sp.]